MGSSLLMVRPGGMLGPAPPSGRFSVMPSGAIALRFPHMVSWCRSVVRLADGAGLTAELPAEPESTHTSSRRSARNPRIGRPQRFLEVAADDEHAGRMGVRTEGGKLTP